jgi:1-deoxy-D-xylulose 5-phosphate reductoisomerase
VQIEGLAAGTNVKLLNEQIRKYNPKIVSVANEKVQGNLVHNKHSPPRPLQ